MLALMTNIVQFAYWNVQKKRRKQGHWYMYRPVYLLIFSSFLVCLQPTCMLIIGSWRCDGYFSADQIDTSLTHNATGYYKVDGSYAGRGFFPNGTFDGQQEVVLNSKGDGYAPGCSPSMKNFFFDGGKTNALVPNTVVGWMIQLFGTYLGFACMFVGVCQATMLHIKIAQKWQQIRSLS